ncbi:MAG: transcriptional regulator NrdR [Chlamydiae bacterium]|nr:transcriptional regulator NrdR [Chlamydiota bacterium]
MKCPFCTHDELKVTDSRNTPELNAIRRRRECLGCGRRFTTFETVELNLQVHKRDGRFEDFSQQKLIDGLDAACRHTQMSSEQIKALVARIMGDLMAKQTKEIATRELGEIVMQHLRLMDPIAYIRFACVYKRMKKIDQLIAVIDTIRAKDDEQGV